MIIIITCRCLCHISSPSSSRIFLSNMDGADDCDIVNFGDGEYGDRDEHGQQCHHGHHDGYVGSGGDCGDGKDSGDDGVSGGGHRRLDVGGD